MKTTQQERELIRYDAERGLACMPGQPSIGWLLKLLDDADRCADFEAMSSASPETVSAMLERCAELRAEKNGLLKRLGERCSCDYLKSAQRLGCAVGPLKCDELEAEVRRLREGIEKEICPKCGGVGFLPTSFPDTDMVCDRCDGSGFDGGYIDSGDNLRALLDGGGE